MDNKCIKFKFKYFEYIFIFLGTHNLVSQIEQMWTLYIYLVHQVQTYNDYRLIFNLVS